MAHILLFEVPGGNDFTVLNDALDLGHDVTFCTGDLPHYQQLGPSIQELLARTNNIVEVPDFDESLLLRRLEAIHALTPFHALICLLDIRLAAAAKTAKQLGLRFLAPEAVELTRNKTAVRTRLVDKGIAQPGFDQAQSEDELRNALAKTGYPAIIKPSDGYGSQNLHFLADSEALEPVLAVLFDDKLGYDYGLGVRSNRIYSVEPYMQGQLIGIDVFSDGQTRLMLGINAKKMFPPPSFAIAGSCFPSADFDPAKIRDHTFAALDAVGFDFGAAHIEAIVDGENFYLVEINARLVTAHIPDQMAYAFARSIYADLLDLHLGKPIRDMVPFNRYAFSVIRWITADRFGTLEALVLPEVNDENIQQVITFKGAGDPVQPPLSNGDRIGYVIATGPTEAEATKSAEAYIAATHMRIVECVP